MEQIKIPEIDIEIHLNRKNIIKNYFFVILICTAIAIVMNLTNPSHYFFINFILAQSFGLTMCSANMIMLLIFKPRRWSTFIFITFTSTVGSAIIGFFIAVFIIETIFSVSMNILTKYSLRIIITAIIFSFAISYSFVARARLRHRKELIEQEITKRMAVEKEALSANLRILQAQIEPHFLFNTLSNVVSLIDTQPGKGKSMLLDLTKYLRTSLSRTLPEKTTLDQEIAMIRAYLNIQKIRMDERLNFKIDVPDNMRQQSFPPMLLQPLVENAIKHGLEPKVDGGNILISATEGNNILRIEIRDTGIGFSDFNKPGVGITNVRERLTLLFGENGRLMIEENKPQGVRATIEVPVNDLSSHHCR